MKKKILAGVASVFTVLCVGCSNIEPEIQYIEKEIYIEVPIEKEIIIEKEVIVEVEKEIIKEVEIPVEIEKEVIVEVEKEVIVEVEKEVIVEKEIVIEKEVRIEKEFKPTYLDLSKYESYIGKTLTNIMVYDGGYAGTFGYNISWPLDKNPEVDNSNLLRLKLNFATLGHRTEFGDAVGANFNGKFLDGQALGNCIITEGRVTDSFVGSSTGIRTLSIDVYDYCTTTEYLTNIRSYRPPESSKVNYNVNTTYDPRTNSSFSRDDFYTGMHIDKVLFNYVSFSSDTDLVAHTSVYAMDIDNNKVQFRFNNIPNLSLNKRANTDLHIMDVIVTSVKTIVSTAPYTRGEEITIVYLEASYCQPVWEWMGNYYTQEKY